MKIYSIKRTQFLPITTEQAWDFFSSPGNLAKITPGEMRFRILYTSGNEKIYAGQLIRYIIQVLPFISVHWVTEITHVQEGKYFVDEQRFGPYALWHHEHWFTDVTDGVEMTDEVNYAIPLGFLGRFANWMFVERRVNAIFDYRFTVLQGYFGNTKTERVG